MLSIFTRGRGFFELAHVAVNVFGVGKLLRRADDVAQHLFGSGNGAGCGQMVHQFGGEEFFGGVWRIFAV